MKIPKEKEKYLRTKGGEEADVLLDADVQALSDVAQEKELVSKEVEEAAETAVEAAKVEEGEEREEGKEVEADSADAGDPAMEVKEVEESEEGEEGEEAAEGEENPIVKAFDAFHEAVVAPLTKTIEEQAAKIADLEARIEAIEPVEQASPLLKDFDLMAPVGLQALFTGRYGSEEGTLSAPVETKELAEEPEVDDIKPLVKESKVPQSFMAGLLSGNGLTSEEK